ncbi:hypothetical protein, partial [Streptococcus thoraltensis]|uniref:hypothetical protein n=1 Tax=Streptococcus thoraltensis TaxID=55085 RepID=UPI001FD62511
LCSSVFRRLVAKEGVVVKGYIVSLKSKTCMKKPSPSTSSVFRRLVAKEEVVIKGYVVSFKSKACMKKQKSFMLICI